MADTDTDTTTAPAPGTVSPDLLAQLGPLLKQLMPQPVQQDTTPVSRSGISLLGEALAGGAPVAGMSDADKETAGTRALMNFSTGLMAASRYQPGQTIFSNLAQGFQGAQRGEIGAEEMAMAKLGAQQEYAQQQGQNKLEAIKTALPFLTLQQQMRIMGQPNPLAGGGAPPAPNVAQGGSIADPAAALPKDQALAAVVQRESGGKNIPTAILGPDGKPASTATGYYQMLDNTWQEGAALAGIKNPPPRAMDASKADQDAAASALYDKYKLMPWAKSAPTPTAPSGSPPASTASTTPPAPVVHTSPTLRGPGTPVPPTPQPSIQGVPDTGGAQVAGPGALPGKVAPPGPAVPGDVNAIIAGMKGGGADPTTLAPGAATAGPAAPTIAQGGPPTVTPPAQPTPQVSTQQPTDTRPDVELTLPQYIQRYFQPPTDADRQTFTVGVNPASVQAQQAVVQNAQRNLAAAAQDRGNAITPEARAAANKNYDQANNTLQSANATLADIQGKADTATAAAAAKFAEDQRARLATTYNQLQAQKATAAVEAQKGQQAIALEQAKGRTADESKVMQSLDETRESARTAIDQVGIARALSQSAGDPTFWQTVQKSHPDLVQTMANTGFLSPETVTQLGQAGASDAAMQKLISMARTGSGFQRMTNLDVQILTSQAPQSVDPQAWREAKMDYLQSYMTRQMRYVDAVRSLRADGTPLYQAQTQAEKDMGDVVPTIPNFNDTPQKTAVQQRIDWAQDHLAPNTFFRAPDGKLVIYRGQQGQTAPPTTAPTQSKSLVPVN